MSRKRNAAKQLTAQTRSTTPRESTDRPQSLPGVLSIVKYRRAKSDYFTVGRIKQGKTGHPYLALEVTENLRELVNDTELGRNINCGIYGRHARNAAIVDEPQRSLATV